MTHLKRGPSETIRRYRWWFATAVVLAVLVAWAMWQLMVLATQSTRNARTGETVAVLNARLSALSVAPGEAQTITLAAPSGTDNVYWLFADPYRTESEFAAVVPGLDRQQLDALVDASIVENMLIARIVPGRYIETVHPTFAASAEPGCFAVPPGSTISLQNMRPQRRFVVSPLPATN